MLSKKISSNVCQPGFQMKRFLKEISKIVFVFKKLNILSLSLKKHFVRLILILYNNFSLQFFVKNICKKTFIFSEISIKKGLFLRPRVIMHSEKLIFACDEKKKFNIC